MQKPPRLLFLLVLGLFSVTAFWTPDVSAQNYRFRNRRQNTDSQTVSKDVQSRSTNQKTQTPSPAPTPTPKKQNYALLIGINQYTADTETMSRKSTDECGYLVFNSLRYCIADMKGLRDALLKGEYADPKNIILLTDDNESKALRPTYDNIVRYLNEINSKTKENDAVLIAFAGHGVALPGQSDQAQSYLCPMDAEVSRNTDSGEWNHDSLIPLSLLFKGSETKKGVHKIAILDACRNVGDVQGGGRNAITLVRGSETQSLELPNFQEYDLARFKKLDRLASCGEGQRAHEDPKLNHGVYSNFMIEGLQGKADSDKNGEITVQELTQYVAEETKNYVQKTFRQEQSPTYSASESETFVIAHCPKPRDDGGGGGGGGRIPPPPKPKPITNPK
ncbi:MAG: caspase family protein [Planctomycetaceae bacterium]|jgi:uncharacterized caspase-like protein|nr:caspase family protein [Planctomycetaceae bacterium]